ncbi:methyltransferase [Xanthocytophaga flava]|uniref:methyltransferase n=1 Tax=Xanthocytophaga flava TaxID=3048013 RepID=UPI0028D3C436|nr:methyltransferase [Xanthocytophaga flavus]MDJ1473271.1 methyltransferase [Xanthocytophaga flavus]
METSYQRKYWEGVVNIIRFNWHFYVLAFGIVLVVCILIYLDVFTGLIQPIAGIGTGIAFFYLLGSLVVSHFIYDRSDLYKLTWLNRLQLSGIGTFVNIHSGFDETSLLLQRFFPGADWKILDFYDPAKNTEISIKRARKYKPVVAGTRTVQTTNWNLLSGSVTTIFGFLAIHEIRTPEEKVLFFQEAYRVLEKEGHFILIEHLRDRNNFLAYGPGFFHFFSERSWKEAFNKTEFLLIDQFRISPFISVFVLKK